MFLQGHLYQASFPQVKFQMPAPNSVYSYTSPLGGLPYEKGADARRKFWIKRLKETNLGMSQRFFDP